MKHFLALLSLAIILAGVSHAAAQDGKPLPMDKDVRIGRLSNGMTYFIKHNADPADRADFFIAHNVGALQEEDNQNGLAHFLEHMAFNGSKHFPGNGMLEYTAAVGVRFGYNVNAYTSRERTVYNISNVPLARESVTDSILLILHDWSGFLTLTPDQIEKERGVIREEWRLGYDTRRRMVEKQAEIEYAGSKYGTRNVIGDPEIIRTFERPTLVEFYKKWYRPDMQAIIVVGDVDVDRMEKKIRDLFSAIPPAVNPTPKETFDLPDHREPVIATVSDPETQAVAVKLIFRQPYPSAAERRMESFILGKLHRDIYTQMIKDRLALVEKPDTAAFRRAIAVSGNMYTLRQTLMITIMPQKDTNMIACVEQVGRELERIRRYGFTGEEFDAAKKRASIDMEKALDRVSKRKNTELANLYVDAFTQNLPYMTFEDESAITRTLFEGIVAEDLEDMSARMIPYENSLVIFNIPEQSLGRIPSDEQVRLTLAALQSEQVSPFETAGKRQLTIFPVKEVIPGKTVSVKDIDAVGAQEWKLSNGARILWMPMKEAADKMAVYMFGINYGGYNRTEDYVGMDILDKYMRLGMGFGDASRDELREYLATYRATAIPSLGKEYSSINGQSSDDDFELMLQLLNRYMADPNFNRDVYEKTMERIRLNMGKTSDQTVFSDSSALVKYGNHRWLRKAGIGDLDGITPQRLRALYDAQFGNPAEFTFYFAGTVPADKAKELIEKYIGSLPGTKPADISGEVMGMAEGIREIRYQGTPSVTPKVDIGRIYWGTFDVTARNHAALRYVTYILGDRYLKSVREEKGGTYYIGVQNDVREHPYTTASLIVSFQTNPSMADMLLEEVQKGIEALAADGPTEQELTEARLYYEKVDSERRDNNNKSPKMQLEKLRTYDLTGVDLKLDDPGVFSTITAQEVRDMARSILSQGNRYTSLYIQ